MSDVLTKDQRRYCMSRIRGKNTKPEISLRKALWAAGFRYRLKNRLPGRPDIVFPGKRLAVFVDGCFWHRCPRHCRVPTTNREFWENKLGKNVQRDKDVKMLLERQGWEVVRFWEHEIKESVSKCVERVSLLIG